ncbi:unnamed protein product [Malus baccata var. baccata]
MLRRRRRGGGGAPQGVQRLVRPFFFYENHPNPKRRRLGKDFQSSYHTFEFDRLCLPLPSAFCFLASSSPARQKPRSPEHRSGRHAAAWSNIVATPPSPQRRHPSPGAVSKIPRDLFIQSWQSVGLYTESLKKSRGSEKREKGELPFGQLEKKMGSMG